MIIMGHFTNGDVVQKQYETIENQNKAIKNFKKNKKGFKLIMNIENELQNQKNDKLDALYFNYDNNFTFLKITYGEPNE